MTATSAANRVTVRWTALEGEPFVDDVWLEARRGGVLQATRVTSGDATSLDLTGLTPGRYELRVRALNAYGEGPISALDVDVTGTAATFPARLLADQPDLYWRLGDRGGTIVPDLSGHGRDAYRGAERLQPVDGALVGDDDGAASASGSWSWRGTTLARLPKAEGLPTGARTVEAWVRTDVPGARVIEYGDFSVEVEARALVVSGERIELPAGDPRTLTNARWHHVAVTYADGTLTAYLDGAALGSATKTLATTTDGDLRAAQAPAYAQVRFDELALYPRALDAATVAAHFAASGNALPAAPDATATVGQNRVTVRWPAPTGGAPAGQLAIEHYLVEAPGLAQLVPATGTEATLGGIPAGATTVTVRAFNGFGPSPAKTLEVTVPGAATTYASTVAADAPVLYWRLGERGGTQVADSSGHGRSGRTWQDFAPYAGAGALPGDPDGGFAYGYQWWQRLTIDHGPATGLPDGDRTVEAWVRGGGPGLRPVAYGDFTVELEARAIVVSGTRIALPEGDRRQLTDGVWHHVAVTLAGGTATAYLDGEPVGSATLTVPTERGDLADRAHPRPGIGTSASTRSRSTRARSTAARIAAHFEASGNGRPRPPAGLAATGAANAVTVSWTAPAARRRPRATSSRPGRARRCAARRAPPPRPPARRSAACPRARTRSRSRGLNGYGTGRESRAARHGHRRRHHLRGRGHRRRPGALLAPRRAQRHAAADSSGHGRHGAYPYSNLQRAYTGAITGDADRALAGVDSWGAVDLVQLLAGDRPADGRPHGRGVRHGRRPGRGCCSPTATSTLRFEDRAVVAGDVRLALPPSDDRRFTDSQLAPLRGHGGRRDAHAYLDGEPVATAPGTLATPTDG